MSINVFVNSLFSDEKDDNFVTTLFVQEPYLKSNPSENRIENIDMKNQSRIKSLLNPSEPEQPPIKLFVDTKSNDPSIIRNNAHVDFNDKNHDNVRFVKVNSLPGVRDYLTPKLYVDQCIDEPTLVKNFKNNAFNNNSSTNIS